jgi:predicted O-methyltransferase YrrM
MKEISKLCFLLTGLLDLILKSALSKDLKARRVLTYLYLELLYRRSLIPSISLTAEEKFSINISSEFIMDGHREIHQRFALLTEKELFGLLTLIKIKKPKTILEFGLMRGGSLLHFFLNTNDDVEIHSVDMNDNLLEPHVKEIVKSNKRIHLHLKNSFEFDPTPFSGKIDFIFIDAGHDYLAVKNDSEKALKMISSKGIIVWDDYHPEFPGVYQYLNEFYQSDNRLRHIEGTSFVVLADSLR